MITLRGVMPKDYAAIVELNDDVVALTSPMDIDRLTHLIKIGADCVVTEKDKAVIGFILVMEQECLYENGNFNWFKQRLDRFIYIDRIVISKAGRGQGLGGKLYAHIVDLAHERNCLTIAAEMNLIPPNEHSLGFHKKQGFVELGTRALDHEKIVSMQIKEVKLS